MALTSGSCAMEIYEPCQGGNTAALSRSFHVTRGSLEGVNCEGNVYCEDSKRDARFFIINFCLARGGGQPLRRIVKVKEENKDSRICIFCLFGNWIALHIFCSLGPRSKRL